MVSLRVGQVTLRGLGAHLLQEIERVRLRHVIPSDTPDRQPADVLFGRSAQIDRGAKRPPRATCSSDRIGAPAQFGDCRCGARSRPRNDAAQGPPWQESSARPATPVLETAALAAELRPLSCALGRRERTPEPATARFWTTGASSRIEDRRLRRIQVAVTRHLNV